MPDGLESGHSSRPTTMAMRIEEAAIGFFQVALGSEASRGQRAATFRASKEKDVRKLLECFLQRTLAFPRARDQFRLAEVARERKTYLRSADAGTGLISEIKVP